MIFRDDLASSFYVLPKDGGRSSSWQYLQCLVTGWCSCRDRGNTLKAVLKGIGDWENITMQSSRSLRSLGHLTAPHLCYRKATAPSNAAYCGVMFFNRLRSVCVERGGKVWRGRAKKRPLQRIEEKESPHWSGWWLRSVLWNQVLMAVR